MPQGAPRSRDASRTHRTDIQGLRAIAVLSVVLYHSGVATLSGGYVGVDVFFVISGFLITGHLLTNLERQGRIDFARFYARRIRRIIPASMAVMVLTAVAAWFFVPSALLPKVLGDAAATAMYVPNVAFAIQGTDYLAETAPSPFQHYWSLGIEEQFYLFWPLVLLLLWTILARGHRPRALAVVVAILVGLSLIAGAVLTLRSQPWAFFSLPTRAWELGVGALIALIGPTIAKRLPRPAATAGAWLGLALILVSVLRFDAGTHFPGVAALVPVSGAALVIFCGQAPTGRALTLVLGNQVMQWIGRISYSLYLVHWPLLVLPALAAPQGLLPLEATLALGALSVPLAWLLHHAVEEPFRERRGGWRLQPRVVIGSAIVLALIVSAGAIGLARVVEARPTHTDSAVTSAGELTSPPDFTGFVPSNLSPNLQEADGDLPAVYANGCHLDAGAAQPQSCSFGDIGSDTRVALFGDSHAASWFPALNALAENEGFRLDVYTKSSCPSAEVPILRDGNPYADCADWRSAVIDRLVESPPDTVIMSNLANYPGQGEGFTRKVWSDGVGLTVARLADLSRVVVISDTPAFPQTPAICLSSHLTDATACDTAVGEAIDPEWLDAEAAAATAAGGRVVTLNDYFCDEERCGAIIGSTLVYRDATHFTATFSRQMADPLWERLSPLLR
ncbi:acyltransferase family protein [Salinibacterium sp. GXW1014]|uniref:acyltransferase family protein n=1 Tax=Salinibacterium sp. GXW1014 TaxID=3377838 RepID=UPI00383BA5A0